MHDVSPKYHNIDGMFNKYNCMLMESSLLDSKSFSFTFLDQLFLIWGFTSFSDYPWPALGNLSRGHWFKRFLSRRHVRNMAVQGAARGKRETGNERSWLLAARRHGGWVAGRALRGAWVWARKLGSDQGRPATRVKFADFLWGFYLSVPNIFSLQIASKRKD